MKFHVLKERANISCELRDVAGGSAAASGSIDYDSSIMCCGKRVGLLQRNVVL